MVQSNYLYQKEPKLDSFIAKQNNQGTWNIITDHEIYSGL